MERQAVDLLRLGQLRDRAEVHHRHPVADVLDDAHVVRDEQVGQAQLALQAAEQVEDLCLDADVERAHRLVEHEQVRLEDEGARDPDPLPLAAAELVRIAAGVVRGKAHQLHDARHPIVPLLCVGQAVDAQPLADAGADRRPRVERRVRVLEDDLHPAAERLELRSRQRRDVGAVEQDPAAGRLDQPQERAPDGRLATARLADEAERLAATDREADVVDRLHVADLAAQDAAHQREELAQVLDLDERVVTPRGGHVRGPSALSGRARTLPSASW